MVCMFEIDPMIEYGKIKIGRRKSDDNPCLGNVSMFVLCLMQQSGCRSDEWMPRPCLCYRQNSIHVEC